VEKLGEAGVKISIHDFENASRHASQVKFECLYWSTELHDLVGKLKSKFPTFDPSPLICAQKNPLEYDHERHARLSKSSES
jgi:hypothetical protein